MRFTHPAGNEEVLQMVGTEREMMDTLRSRQKRWLGYSLLLYLFYLTCVLIK